MHLLLLLSLAAVSHLSAGAATEMESGKSIDVSSCSILFYGASYDKLYMDKDSTKYRFCLKGQYTSGGDNICIETDVGDITEVQYEILNNELSDGSTYHSKVSGLKGTSTCQLKITLTFPKGSFEIDFAKFVDTAPPTTTGVLRAGVAPGFIPKSFKVTMKDVEQETLELTTSVPSVYKDVTGCKKSRWGRFLCLRGALRRQQ